MPKPYKMTRPYPLPANAELVDVDGRPHVRVKVRGKLTLCRISKDGTKYLQPSKRWFFDIPGEGRQKGFTDLKATEELAREKSRRAERKECGYSDPAEEHVRRPLADHLKDYATAMEARGGTVEHVRQTVGRVSALFVGCGFVFPLDADAGKAAEWLNALRRDAVPVELPALDSFTPAEAAKLLGISGAAIRSAVKRLGLSATGQGKARTFPRSTVEALVMRAGQGRGPETINHYVRAVRGFFRWLVKARRLGSNPLESLTLVNASADVRRTRRELNAEELRRLFVAARGSARAYRGLTGEDRYMLYLVAAGTGFRANALANLTPADFDLNAATVTLAARLNKSRKLKVQPLPAEVAEALYGYLDGKPDATPVWGGTWARDHRGAEMLRIDLEACGIPYATEGPDGPEYADFHSLRHSYLTLGGRSGIDLRTLQELAGHSKPELTARYSHRRLYDLAGAVDKLPNLVLPRTSPDSAEMPLRLTGTDGRAGMKADKSVRLGVVPGVVTGRAESHQSASKCITGSIRRDSTGSSQTLEMKGAGASQHRPASICTSEDDGTRTRNHRIDSVIRRPSPTPLAKAVWVDKSLPNHQLPLIVVSHRVSSILYCIVQYGGTYEAPGFFEMLDVQNCSSTLNASR
jgi:integrase